jgi:TolB protein
LESLRSVLTQDLNRNGSCFVEEGEGSDFCIDLELTGKSLSALVELKRGGVTKTLGPYSLSGTLSSDRRMIHKFHDDLSQIITGKRGIASTRLLFALQLPEKTKEGLIWRSEIWESDYDGENTRQITEENSYCLSPNFFPSEGEFTKGKFMYVNYKKGQPKIYISSFNAPSGTPFLPLRGNQLLPTVSQRGDLIAFISDASGRADLFIQLFSSNHGPMGKPIQVFSHPNSVQASPTFRPDGKKIAFVSDKNGTPHIFLIDTPYPGRQTSTRPIFLTKNYRHNTCPAWSPDGTKLAYSAMIDGIRQIMVYDFLTQEEIPLTRGTSHKENPTWAPNSLHIIYNTVDLSSSELYIINIKQKEPLQITSGPGKKHYPTWELTRGPL